MRAAALTSCLPPCLCSVQDPGNLESDLQTGAQTGYSLLWLLACTMCMGACFARRGTTMHHQRPCTNNVAFCPTRLCTGFLVQMQAARLGVATGITASRPRPLKA